MDEQPPRLAELIGSLSLATDLAAGLGPETALRTALLAVRTGAALGLRDAALADVFYTALLRFIGCTAFAHEMAWRYGGGDDLGLIGALAPADVARPTDIVRLVVQHAGKGMGAGRRVQAVARTLSDPAVGVKIATAHCDLAVRLAARLGMTEGVVVALGQIYERYDGKGGPHGLGGEQLSLPARLLHIAWRAEVQRAIGGPAEAWAVVQARARGELDPDVVAAFGAISGEALAEVDRPSVWEGYLAAEPRPYRRVAAAELATIADAFARYVDIKSPFTLAHSTGMAALAGAAGDAAGLGHEVVEQLRVSALLHDIGRVSVPNGIWDKPGPLNPLEWERVRQHAYQSERILGLSPLLAGFARVVGRHHERADGSGYHRGITDAALDEQARLLAAADVYHALTEERAYRPAQPPPIAARQLTAEANAGRLGRRAVEAVLAAAGQRVEPARGELPAALSEREVEVLVLMARGLSNRQMADRLIIAPATVKRHVEHIYQKTGLATRAAAAIFAVDHGLLPR